MSISDSERIGVARRRIVKLLGVHIIASARIVEQKVSDAGPFNQRIDPHLLTRARQELENEGTVAYTVTNNVRWYYLTSVSTSLIQNRLAELQPIHDRTVEHNFTLRVGQALEIAVFKALRQQNQMAFFGAFLDLDEHDDSKAYQKEEPPSTISGKQIQGGKKLDFLLQHSSGGFAGLEAKNIREWLYPDRDEIKDLLSKCCAVDAVPVLIGRRIPYATFTVLNPCGVIIHQTYNQLYPAADHDLAELVSNKRLLGYHDVRVGNEPDSRLVKFIHVNLPKILTDARVRFEQFKDLLGKYGNRSASFDEFLIEVRKRQTP